MASATLTIKTRDGTIESFSEPVGDYETMNKSLNRLQDQSNTFLTVHVEKEKKMNLSSQNDDGVEDNEDDEESDDDEDDNKDKKDQDGDQDIPPEKKIKL